MNNLGGVLLTGGYGTRLFPNTKVVNKHLLPIYDKPMVYYSLSILMLTGIREITIVCNPKDEPFYNDLLGNGKKLGININYSLQDSPEGIPHAINTALEVNSFDRFMVVLGDNFLYGRDFFNNLESNFISSKKPSIYYQKVKNPELFGVIKWDGDNISDIIEKPSPYISSDAVIGVYIFDSNFKNHFQKLKKSSRNEFEIVDLIKDYQLENIDSHYVGRGTAWFDMGSNDDFFNCSQFVKTIQDRQGLLLCSPHEIAYRKGWIGFDEIIKSIEKYKNSEYATTLERTIRNEL
jgi:glucose-1-phosphate thymidylyltransferase